MTGLLIRDLKQVVSPAGTAAPLRGRALASVDLVEDAFILCRDGVIAAVGAMRDLPRLDGEVDELDGRGLCAIPGLVDCHTHIPFGGDRVDQWDDLQTIRIEREPPPSGRYGEYLPPEQRGMLPTIRATRAMSDEEMRASAETHKGWLLANGTTTFEGKSGYGLDRETELRQLRTVKAAGGSPTWMGAHMLPPEFSDADSFVDFLLNDVLPQAAPIAEAADIFVAPHTFPVPLARRYLTACREAGLRLRLHADEIGDSGAVPLALELGACSVDHLTHSTPESIAAVAASDLVAVLLPAVGVFHGGGHLAPARTLIDQGAAVALATDFNPGSGLIASLPLVCSIATGALKMQAAETLGACTVNAAHVLRRADRKGRVAAGYDADIVLLDAPDWRYLAYHFAGNIVSPGDRRGRAV